MSARHNWAGILLKAFDWGRKEVSRPFVELNAKTFAVRAIQIAIRWTLNTKSCTTFYATSFSAKLRECIQWFYLESKTLYSTLYSVQCAHSGLQRLLLLTKLLSIIQCIVFRIFVMLHFSFCSYVIFILHLWQVIIKFGENNGQCAQWAQDIYLQDVYENQKWWKSELSPAGKDIKLFIPMETITHYMDMMWFRMLHWAFD